MTELDSFFARKDRKKTSGRRQLSGSIVKLSDLKSVPPEGVNLPGDETYRDANKTRIDVPRPSNEEDDEWRSVESEKKDYSGLKLQPLILPEEEEVESEPEEGKTKPNGPWKIAEINSGGNPSDENTPNALPSSAPSSTSQSKPGVYVHPRERMLAKTLETPVLKTSRTVPPDVKSILVFPSLSQVEKSGGLRSNQSVWNRSTRNEGNTRVNDDAWTSNRDTNKDNVISREKSDSASSNIKFSGGLSTPNTTAVDSTKPGKYVPPNMRNKLTSRN